jgi:hypothetical protein
LDTASDLKAFMVRQIEELQLAYAIGGSMAAMAYSVPRFTRDVDIVVDLPLDRVPDFLARFPRPDFYIDEVAVRQATTSPASKSISTYQRTPSSKIRSDAQDGWSANQEKRITLPPRS